MAPKIVAKEPLRLPPRQQYTSGRQSRGNSITWRSMCAEMLRAAKAAPRFLASKALTCLYIVPMSMRSWLLSVGQLMAPGTWSRACSSSVRASMMASKVAKLAKACVAGRV